MQKKVQAWANHIAAGSESAMKEVPSFVQDFIKGVSTGMAVSLPFLVIWLSFNHPKTFAFGYMKEASLLVLWLFSVVHLWPLKSLKVGKDGVHLEFAATAISPEKATSN